MERSLRLRPAFAASIGIRGRQGRQYQLQRGQWDAVDSDRDALYLMSPQLQGGIGVEADRELGPVWLTSVEHRTVPLQETPSRQRTVEFVPHRLVKLPRHVAYQVVKDDDDPIRPAKATHLLNAVPHARIVVIRDMGIGDVMFVSAAVDRLRERYPHATVDYVVAEPYQGLVGGLSLWEALDRAPYDAVFDLINYFEGAGLRGSVDRVQLAARRLGLTDAWPMRARVSETAREQGRQVASGRVCLALHGSNWSRGPSKAWQTRLIELLGDIPIVIIGVNPVGPFPDNVINLTGKTQMDYMVGVLAESDTVVAVDSGPMHIANAMEKKLVGLFGPVRPELRVRERHGLVTFTGNQAAGCHPCSLATEALTCKAPPPCFERISVERVAEATKELYSGHPSS